MTVQSRFSVYYNIISLYWVSEYVYVHCALSLLAVTLAFGGGNSSGRRDLTWGLEGRRFKSYQKNYDVECWRMLVHILDIVEVHRPLTIVFGAPSLTLTTLHVEWVWLKSSSHDRYLRGSYSISCQQWTKPRNEMELIIHYVVMTCIIKKGEESDQIRFHRLISSFSLLSKEPFCGVTDQIRLFPLLLLCDCKNRKTFDHDCKINVCCIRLIGCCFVGSSGLHNISLLHKPVGIWLIQHAVFVDMFPFFNGHFNLGKSVSGSCPPIMEDSLWHRRTPFIHYSWTHHCYKKTFVQGLY